MYEERTYGIEVPPDEQSSFIAQWKAGGDSATKDGLTDQRQILEIAGDAYNEIMDIAHQQVPEKYIILRMCSAIRSRLNNCPTILDVIETKYR